MVQIDAASGPPRALTPPPPPIPRPPRAPAHPAATLDREPRLHRSVVALPAGVPAITGAPAGAPTPEPPHLAGSAPSRVRQAEGPPLPTPQAAPLHQDLDGADPPRARRAGGPPLRRRTSPSPDIRTPRTDTVGSVCIKNDDKMIQAEGLESLSEYELRQACREQGHLGLLSTEEMRLEVCSVLLAHVQP